MALAQLESAVRWLGGILAAFALAVIFLGIWQGGRRSGGQTVGRYPGLLRSPLFYFVTGTIFFTVCFLLWKPLPFHLSPIWRSVALVIGSVLYFPGIALAIWGRLALGKMYFVSTGMGAQLFEDHRLITRGPYALVRHPMYLGITLAVLGGLLLYQTWTMAALLLLPLGLTRRSRIEEKVLAAQFGEQWQDYAQKVPSMFPRGR
jgi:protein-S-isoprenylcysteine O-methyltransferase Ste14